VVLSLAAALACSAQTNVLTYHNDNARTGQNLNETILTPSDVNSTNFGKLGFLSVDGLVDAQPLYVSNLTVAGAPHNVVFIVTEHDSVYVFDADTFAQLWKVTVLGSNETPSDNRGCDQVTPEIGITSTPVIDLNAGPHGTMYLVAMSKDTRGNYYQRLHALDLTTGAEQAGSPTTIQATFPKPGGGGQVVTFDPKQYKERASLLLLNGVIYTAWASHCDYPPYAGWVMGYSESTLQQVSVLNITPNGSEGAIWMSGAGPAADAPGNIYFLAANGTFDTTLNANGFPVNGDYGNAFIKLSTGGNSLSGADYFTMHNTVPESNVDQDLGSGGALLLPDLKDGLGNPWHLAVGAGKDGNIYVVNRDSMGKFNPNNDSAIYQEIASNGLSGAVFAMPAYFNNTIYYGAVGDSLKAFSISSARLVTPPSSKTASTFAYPGTTPSISANGTSNGIVWAVENNGGAGILHAYGATNLANELYNSNQAANGRDHFSDNKFITPMIANGKVYVGTPTGVILFGLLNGAPPTLVSLAVTPANSSIAKGTTQQFTATGTFSDGSTQNLTNSATWSSSNTSVATINSTGLASSVGVGNSTIQAASASVTGLTTLTVTAAVLSSLAVTPANSAIAKGVTQQFTATGTFSDGSTQNLTNTVAWTSTNTAVATITSNGLATGVAPGSTTMQAAWGSVSSSISLTVTPPVLVSLAVTPANPSIAKGTTQQFTATGTFSDGSTQNLTNTVAWASTNTAVATITNTGLATGVAPGSTTMQAALGLVSGSAGLTVTPVLVSLAVTPANSAIAKGTTQQFTATGTFSDGSTQNLTNTVAWTSTNTAVATITGSGLAIGVAPGSTTTQAALGSVTGSTPLAVNAAVP
jgi:hypothetical protein